MQITPPPIDPINVTYHRPKRTYFKAWLVMMFALLVFILLAFV